MESKRPSSRIDLAMRAKYHGKDVAGRVLRGEGRMTYRDLLKRFRDLGDAGLDQPVQVFKDTGNHNEPVCLMPAYEFGTVAEMCHVDGQVARETRGPDFAHHPEQLILLIDGAPFSPQGDTMYTLEDGGMRGDKTGKLFPFGGDEAVAEPESWEAYGRMAYVKWRTGTTDPRIDYDEAGGEWAGLGEDIREVWRSVAKSSAVMAYPVLSGEEKG